MSKRINRKPYNNCQNGIGAATTTLVSAAALAGGTGAGRLFCLKSIVLCNSHASVDQTVTLKRGTTNVLADIVVKAGQPPTGISLGEDGVPGAPGEAWTLVSTGAGTLSVTIFGHFEG